MSASKVLHSLCLLLGALAIVAGVCGMAFSFRYLRIATLVDATAGGAGFLAGSILVASGLIVVALVAGPGHRPHD